MNAAPRCPDCRVAMEEGFVPDRAHNAILQTQWHRGPVEKATFFGLEVGVKAPKAALIPIRAFRCPRCGLLVSYALPDPKKS